MTAPRRRTPPQSPTGRGRDSRHSTDAPSTPGGWPPAGAPPVPGGRPPADVPPGGMPPTDAPPSRTPLRPPLVGGGPASSPPTDVPAGPGGPPPGDVPARPGGPPPGDVPAGGMPPADTPPGGTPPRPPLAGRGPASSPSTDVPAGPGGPRPGDVPPGGLPPADTPPAGTPPRPSVPPQARPSSPPPPPRPWTRSPAPRPSDAVPPAARRSAEGPSSESSGASGSTGPHTPEARRTGGSAALAGAAASASAPPPDAEPSDARPSTQLDLPTLQAQEITLVTGSRPVRVDYVGSGPPTYDAEPTALPAADPEDLGDLVADTVLDGARYGACTLRAASLRGDSARYRGEPRRDALLTARFGVGEQALVLVAMATGARATPGAHRAAAEACRWIGRAVGLSHARLVEDIRAGRRGDLKSGLHRLTDRSLGKLRAGAVEQGLDPEEYTASLRCLLLPADPRCRTRVFFGVGAGGLFRLRDGEWQDIEPRVADTAGAPVVGFGSLPHETPDGDRLTMDLGITTPPSPYEPAPVPPREPFRFRASVAREDDVLLLCTGGLAEPLRGEAPLAEHLAARWGAAEPPGLAAFLADAQVRVKGYADDRTAAAVWEA
ncbi:protein phosphatase 2C domain-containing protein [Streptomyces sp. CA-210063]|nr:protein phosphatase 2C domain-containing protein [Streptomyces sp. CA-210063]